MPTKFSLPACILVLIFSATAVIAEQPPNKGKTNQGFDKGDLYFNMCRIDAVEGNDFVGIFCPCDNDEDIPISGMCAGPIGFGYLVQSGTTMTPSGVGGGATCLWTKSLDDQNSYNARVWCLDVIE